jgi:pyruvate dehydrogenase E2 component (dihydrolipoamide acetyltransferase)
MANIIMPRFSDSMTEGTVISWLKNEGDLVQTGEELVEIETDKATMVYEAPESGALVIVAAAGTTIAVGEPIATIGGSEAATPAPSVEDRGTPPSSNDGEAEDERDALITPVARRLAEVYGVDLSGITGTGRRGRVLRRDIEAAAARMSAEPGGVVADELAAPELQASTRVVDNDVTWPAGLTSTRVDPTRIQQVIAERMTETKQLVPDFQLQTEVMMDAALELRAQLKLVLAEAAPSINDLIVKASAIALRDFPRANGSYVDGQFQLHGQINVGIAVATPDALLVPVIRDADSRPITSIAAESRLLAARARSGEIAPAEMAGGTFTVSNLGMYGVRSVAPIINSPQAAILGVGGLRTVPAVREGGLVERAVLTLILNCDHRILYGAEAAQFLDAIRILLEQPLRLAVEI